MIYFYKNIKIVNLGVTWFIVCCSNKIPSCTLWSTHFKLSYNGIFLKVSLFPGYLYSAENLDFRGFLIRVGSQNSIPSKEEGVGEFISLDSSIQKHVCSKVRNGLGQHLRVYKCVHEYLLLRRSYLLWDLHFVRYPFITINYIVLFVPARQPICTELDQPVGVVCDSYNSKMSSPMS